MRNRSQARRIPIQRTKMKCDDRWTQKRTWNTLYVCNYINGNFDCMTSDCREPFQEPNVESEPHLAKVGGHLCKSVGWFQLIYDNCIMGMMTTMVLRGMCQPGEKEDKGMTIC